MKVAVNVVVEVDVAVNNKPKKKINKTNLFKIVLVLLIFAVIGGIWFLKNNEKNENTTLKNEQTEVKNEQSGTDSEQSSIEDDFALHVVEALDLEKLKSYELPIVIDFGADSCISCKEMASVLKELNIELQGKAIIKFVDVWKYQKLAEGYPISVIPTQVFFDKEGKPYNPSDPEKVQVIMYSMKETNEHALTIHEGGMTKEQLISVLKEMGLGD